MSFNSSSHGVLPNIALGAALLALTAFSPNQLAVSSADRPTEADADRTSEITADLHLTLDMRSRELTVKLGDVVMREFCFTVLGDGDDVEDSIHEHSSTQLDTHRVMTAHLIAAAEMVPKSELQIIADETRVAADLIQRYRPGEMVIVMSDGVCIYVESECPDARPFRWEQAMDLFRRIWDRLAGNDTVRIGLSADDAMSLYGITRSKPQLIIR